MTTYFLWTQSTQALRNAWRLRVSSDAKLRSSVQAEFGPIFLAFACPAQARAHTQGKTHNERSWTHAHIPQGWQVALCLLHLACMPCANKGSYQKNPLFFFFFLSSPDLMLFSKPHVRGHAIKSYPTQRRIVEAPTHFLDVKTPHPALQAVSFNQREIIDNIEKL